MAGLPIVLSRHAEERCKLRGIDPRRVLRDCATLPPVTGVIKWRFRGYAAVVAPDDGRVVVVTVTRKRGRK
jgi:hypothetical protein